MLLGGQQIRERTVPAVGTGSSSVGNRLFPSWEQVGNNIGMGYI